MQHIARQRRFARARYPRDHRQSSQRHARSHALQVVQLRFANEQ